MADNGKRIRQFHSRCSHSQNLFVPAVVVHLDLEVQGEPGIDVADLKKELVLRATRIILELDLQPTSSHA